MKKTIKITVAHKGHIDVGDKISVTKKELRKIVRQIRRGTYCMRSKGVYLVFGKNVLFNAVVGIEEFNYTK